jgi:hypothetical protein
MLLLPHSYCILQCGTTPGWLDALLVCGQTLEAVQKGLEDYLETKRVAFPRYALWQWFDVSQSSHGSPTTSLLANVYIDLQYAPGF